MRKINEVRDVFGELVVTAFVAVCGFALVAMLTSCSILTGDTPSDPVAIGRSLGAISCTVAVTEKPDVAPALAEAVDATLEVLNDPFPSVAAIRVGLQKITDPKARLYVAGTIELVLALFPDLSTNVNDALPLEAIDGLKAALVACQTIVAPTTTSTVATSTTTTTV